MAAVSSPWPAAVGVSGGSDSIALMLLLRDWAEWRGLPPPVVACVDHGIRPESGNEARSVVRWARTAGLRAVLLTGKRPLPGSDIEAACRDLRYGLIGQWARQKRLNVVYVAHTRDDQAETLLLRLARGSGLDGLAAMRAVAPYPHTGFPELTITRPLLGFDRRMLQDYLRAKGQVWFEDPMNGDPRFARARIRNAWPQLEALGLTRSRLADAAAHLGRAREALDTVSVAILARACRPQGQGALLDPAALTGAPRELGLRALAGVLMLVSRKGYRPRFERLVGLFDAIADGTLGSGRTLHGCRITPAASKCAVFGRTTLAILPEKTRRTAGKTSD
jgi:tRNA(Ile)-lysidine synthase